MDQKNLPKIIDFHTHTFPEKIAAKALARLQGFSGITPVTDGTISGTISRFEEFGIDMCVSLNIATSLTAHTTINNICAEDNAMYDGKMVFFGSVNPLSPDALDELDRIKTLGIKGIKVHPDYQGFYTNEKRIYPFYEKVSEIGLPIVFHAGWDCYSPNDIHSTPLMNRQVALDFPNMKMVLAHFGGLNMWEQVRDLLAGLPNVWFDTAMCKTMGLSKELFMEIYNRHSEDRVMLGSDCPWENPAESVKYVESLPLSDAQKEKVFNLNALSLLDII